jgi:hypothetical protein
MAVKIAASTTGVKATITRIYLAPSFLMSLVIAILG